MRISDWSSDVCSSDLGWPAPLAALLRASHRAAYCPRQSAHAGIRARRRSVQSDRTHRPSRSSAACRVTPVMNGEYRRRRLEEHTSELQSLMRNSYAVFCLTKKKEEGTTAMSYTQHKS